MLLLLLLSLQIFVSLDSEKYNILSVQHILSDFVLPLTGLRSLWIVRLMLTQMISGVSFAFFWFAGWLLLAVYVCSVCAFRAYLLPTYATQQQQQPLLLLLYNTTIREDDDDC